MSTLRRQHHCCRIKGQRNSPFFYLHLIFVDYLATAFAAALAVFCRNQASGNALISRFLFTGHFFGVDTIDTLNSRSELRI